MHAASDARKAILLVDDDRKFTRLLAEYLEPFGYVSTAVHTGTEGAERAGRSGERGAQTQEFDAVILDLMLPGMDGFAVLKKIRETSAVPVLMLTSRGDETDRVVGLEIGADDYVAKTASPREILARLRALLRRATGTTVMAAQPVTRDVVVGPLRVVPESRRAFLRDALLTLTPVEFDLLLSLAKARGRVKTRDQLLDEIRDRNYEVFDRSIDVHISALRRKIGDDPRNPSLIRTVRTVGYILDEPDSLRTP